MGLTETQDVEGSEPKKRGIALSVLRIHIRVHIIISHYLMYFVYTILCMYLNVCVCVINDGFCVCVCVFHTVS